MILLSRNVLQRIIGALWLIDGLLQLQPQMFTMNMVNGVMKPMLQGQPGLVESSLQLIVAQTTQHLIALNWVIIVVQIGLGLGLLFLSTRWVRPLVVLSCIWALIVWYGGEGMSMLLTGQASVLTGAPGAVLLYPLLGLASLPRGASSDQAPTRKAQEDRCALSRTHLRYVLAGFWIFAALLQLQPTWWQPGQISQVIGALVGQGGFNAVLVDPVLRQVSNVTANVEVPLNIGVILVFLALGIALAMVKEEQVRPFLLVSIVLSLLFWYLTEAFGMIFTGMATDVNSGLLIVLMALAVFPVTARRSAARVRFGREIRQAHGVEAGSMRPG